MATQTHPLELVKTLRKLQGLSKSISSLYTLVKNRLDTCKEYNISLIGNPILKLETEVIDLNYLVLQHIDICRDFQNLKASQMDPIERQKQIEELRFVYSELKGCYKSLRNKSFAVPIRFIGTSADRYKARF